jgi:hypothetical protein
VTAINLAESHAMYERRFVLIDFTHMSRADPRDDGTCMEFAT